MEKYPSGLEEGLRQAFCTYDFALHADENLTAAQAGNSTAMIHAHLQRIGHESRGQKRVRCEAVQFREKCLCTACVSRKQAQ